MVLSVFELNDLSWCKYINAKPYLNCGRTIYEWKQAARGQLKPLGLTLIEECWFNAVYVLIQFHKFIWGAQFALYTDYEVLCYIHSQKNVNSIFIKGPEIILDYNFSVVHVWGLNNILFTNTALLEMNDHLISIKTDFLNEDTNNDPWIFKDTNISYLFNKHQIAVSDIFIKHKTLSVESYMHELASLTYIFFLSKANIVRLPKWFLLGFTKRPDDFAWIENDEAQSWLFSRSFYDYQYDHYKSHLVKDVFFLVPPICRLDKKGGGARRGFMILLTFFFVGTRIKDSEPFNSPFNDYKQVSESEF